jgi:serine/threonine protein kinase/dipeptidyl aminopeptidase/acylaminoacyl peptidase
MIGKTISHYKILEKLGEGGMGVVYKGRDMKLDRIVALKFLPPHLTKNESDLKRFVQEAKAAAALNHPNVCTIHEIHDEKDQPFIVMEYVEGETARQKTKSNRQNLKHVIAYAVGIAEALNAAHAKGVIHRDIKSDNIMITDDGRVKVMDFGLAKLRGSVQLTKSSSTLGTVAYMSPEHLQGRDVDARADIFSFGVVLYEMLTGHLPFKGEYDSAMMYAIVNEEPEPLTKHRPDLSPEFLHILNRSLEKDPEERYQTVKDMLIDLRRIKRENGIVPRGSVKEKTVTSSGGKSMARGKTMWIFGGLILLAAILFGIYHFIMRGKSAPPFQNMHISRLTTHGKATMAAISPDGKYIVHIKDEEGKSSLWLRHIATESDVRIVPSAQEIYYGLTFSKDGNFVYYIRGEKGELYRIPVLGGSSTKIMERLNTSISFSPDGEYFAFLRWDFITGESALITAKTDGTAETVLATRPLSNAFVANPAWSPDGESIVCGSWYPEDDALALVTVTLDGHVRLLHEKRWTSLSTIAWSPEGNGILLTQRNKLQPNFQIWLFNPAGGTLRRITNDLNDYRSISLTDDGKTLLTVQSDQTCDIWIVPGAETKLARRITSTKYGGANGVSWTPDGGIVHASRDYKLWMVDGDGAHARLLSTDHWNDMNPEVIPDGRYIIFERSEGVSSEVWRMDSNGKNPVRLDSLGISPRCTPDGNWVLYRGMTTEGSAVTCKIPLHGGERIFLPELNMYEFDISPDGKLTAGYIAAKDSESIRLAVMPVEGGDPIRIYTDYPAAEFDELQWAPDGKSITFIRTSGYDVSNIWKQPMHEGAPVQITDFKEKLIFAYDWSRDGDLVCSRGVIDNNVVIIRGIE